MENPEKQKKVILLIRDGWGYRAGQEENAIASAKTPNSDFLTKKYPHVLVHCSGNDVGLPEGTIGNSEVGHLTIGSGRILLQELERINRSIKDGSFFKNEAFLSAIKNTKEKNTSLHIIGLCQTEGVHSDLNHLLALIELCHKENVKNLKLHLITDGRDSPVTNSLRHIEIVLNKINDIGIGEIATVSGRYYAMDRDKRWDRTKFAYDSIVKGQSNVYFDDPLMSIMESHNENITDEFIVPRVKNGYEGIKEGDSVIFFNFRTDRPRQLTQAMVEKDFSGFERQPLKICYVAMTNYYKPMNGLVAFNDIKISNTLGEVISKNNLKQLRMAETEKYAHVTYFFNGQREVPYDGEDRIMVPSQKVSTYDLKPEMSAYDITETLLKEIDTQKYDLIVVNLANPDMLGHTAVSKAIIKAVEVVDDCTGKIYERAVKNDYALIIFADHGNAEDQTPLWRTSHTLNDVPLILISDGVNLTLREDAGLKDIAPTVLDIMGIPKPEDMTGQSIIVH